MDRESVELWNSALEAFRDGKLELSLERFDAMSNTSAGSIYNSAVILQRLQRYEEAIEKLTEATDRDPYFAIALYRRAYVYFLQNRYQEAIGDFESCTRLFRFTKHIDYVPRGLALSLLLSNVTFNTGLCYFISGNQLTGANLMHKVQDAPDLRNRTKINEVLNALEQRTETFEPQLIPLPENPLLFSPLKSVPIKQKDFLGTQRVIASIDKGKSSFFTSQEELHKLDRRGSLSSVETIHIFPPPADPPPRRFELLDQ